MPPTAIRYAVIDIGTNTVKLLVADRRGQELHPLLEDSQTTRLGKDVARTHRLLPEAIERTMSVVGGFVARASELQPRQFLAYATSAVRDASNRDEFRLRFREAAGFDCQVISGDEEAELIFLGATSAQPFRDRDVVVFDIGGGSIEFIRGRGGEIQFKTSLDLGAVRLTETFLKSDPPSGIELADLKNFLDKSMDVLNQLNKRGADRAHALLLLGTGGTISTLAAMELGLDRPIPAKIDGHRFALQRLYKLAEDLSHTPLEQLKRIRGLTPSRADIIVAGVLTLVAGIAAWGQTEILVSARNLRHGAVLKHAALSSG